MTLAELEGEGLLLSSLVAGGEPESAGGESIAAAEAATPVQRLHAAVEAAVARGTLLRLRIEDERGHCDYLFMNTPQGRRAVAQVREGELLLERVGYVREPHVERPRPNIFELYEQNIGLLQPMLAEELAAAERDYPEEWIEDAFRLAVEQNARNWRYVRAILERWAREGKDDGDLGRAAGRRRGGRGYSESDHERQTERSEQYGRSPGALPHLRGTGFVVLDVPVGDPRFGKAVPAAASAGRSRRTSWSGCARPAT
jgi:DnaD/phage-associated family protein